MPTEKELSTQLSRLGAELDTREQWHRWLDSYYESNSPLPAAVVRAKVTAAYQLLMPAAASNWAGLIVDSVQDRLEVAGVRSEDSATDSAVWEIWQNNQMDAESKLGHNSALVDGRAFATVWPGDDGQPEIVLDDSSQMVVQYREGSRRHRAAALRRWVDDDGKSFATLYRPEGIYKFKARRSTPARVPFLGIARASRSVATQWDRREERGETWPLVNRVNSVNVVEVAVNRRLKPGAFGYARGEFQASTGHIDRINILTFLGLVVAFWLGFPVRALIGDKILRDDDDNPLPPWEAMVDETVVIENPDAKLMSLPGVDLSNFSVLEHVEHLAAITKTPAHYLLGKLVNLSADAIRASEAALASKVTNHKASLGEGWEEVLRLGGQMLPNPVLLSPRAEVTWKDHESRSMAERADAAIKLKDILPWQVIAERYLGATQDEVLRWGSQRAVDPLMQLMASVQDPVQNGTPVGVPAVGGGA